MSNAYVYPPGLEHNLIWYAFRKFRPADPIALFQHLAEKHGDIAHYRLGPEHIVFLNHPDYIREILVVQHENFIKERTQQRTRMLLGNGLITADGPPAKAQRRAAQPAFHRQRIAGYAEIMVEHCRRMLSTWVPGQTRDISQDMMQLALGIVARTLFSTELGPEVAGINDSVNAIMRDYTFLIALPVAELLIHLPVPPLRRFKRSRSRLDELVYRLIREHREAETSDGESRRSDLLSMLLAPRADGVPTDEQLRDEILTILLAGYETVANALTWTFYLLSQNPDAENRLHSELDSVLAGRAPSLDDVPRLRYTEMVLAESMRLYPPAWAMGRRALQDFSLGPWRFPARSTVLMCQYVMHRDARYWPDPLRFSPERFAVPETQAGAASEYIPAIKSATVPRFCYFPFGAGPRQCIGESFAWMEGVLAVASIAQFWRLRLVPGHTVQPQPLITLRPKFGMRMTLERRE
jgi:cytochrome P450